MEKQSVLINQASRISDIKIAIAKFEGEEKNYQNDLNEINDIISESGDTIIPRLRDKINNRASAWYLGNNGHFEVQEDFEGYLPDLNVLSNIIVESLKV